MEDQPSVTPHGRTMLDGPTDVTDIERTNSNKVLVEQFVRTILLERRLDSITDYFNGNSLIQHSRAFGDGVSALRTYLTADDNGSGVRYRRLHRVVGEGNFALAQCEGSRAGAPCAFYDLFRVENGKLAEHWTVVQAVPPTLPHENGMF
jgi:predicted SnoaL-like aldol condensation-catalyzing enzyme